MRGYHDHAFFLMQAWGVDHAGVCASCVTCDSPETHVGERCDCCIAVLCLLDVGVGLQRCLQALFLMCTLYCLLYTEV